VLLLAYLKNHKAKLHIFVLVNLGLSGGIVICYVLLGLWIMSCSHTMVIWHIVYAYNWTSVPPRLRVTIEQ